MSTNSFSTKELSFTYGNHTIFGTAYVPENGKALSPVVIMSHGYNSSSFDMTDVAESFAENGIFAYCYDFCGGSSRSKSSGSSLDMSIKTEHRDLSAVIEVISELDFIDKKHIYLYGESQGGFVSALTGAELSDTIAGLFLVYPAFCIPDNWNSRTEEELSKPIDCMGMTLSRTFYDELPRFDVYEYMKQYKNHVMIFHGDADRLVVLSYAERLIDVLPSSELMVIKNEGHGFSAPVRKNIAKKIIDYINNSITGK